MLKAASLPTAMPKAVAPPPVAKKSKAKKGAAAGVSAAEALGEAILSSAQPVTIHFAGSKMEFEAAVERTSQAVTLFITSDGFKWEPPEDTELKITLEDGDVTCAYMGMRVTFGLHGTLLGFIVLSS